MALNANDAGAVYPVPIGVTTSFARLLAGVNSGTFSLIPTGGAFSDTWIITFNPTDINNPGTLTLYDSAGVSLASLSVPGYVFVTGQSRTGCYFTATQGANIAAVTKASIQR